VSSEAIHSFFIFFLTREVCVHKSVSRLIGKDDNSSVPSLENTLDVGKLQALEVSTSCFSQHAVERYIKK